jgi:hypothetical protein
MACKKEGYMKKLLLFASRAALAVLLAFAFTACGDDETIEDRGPDEGTVTIKNESNFTIVDVLWNNTTFADTQTGNSIRPGMSATRSARHGEGFIRFALALNPSALRVGQIFRVERGEEKEFTIFNSTIVEDESGESDQLGSFSGVPLLTVWQGNTRILPYMTCGFAIVRTGIARDITFTIENSGGANLTLDSIAANRVILGENPSGFFSITQQPLGSTIAPGDRRTFTIRFAPTIRESDFSATVQIKSDSHTHGEFTFGVTGKTGVSQIAIRQGTAAITQNAQHDFGTVRTGNTKELAFTLQNSGTEYLNLESVGGNRVILGENPSGFFSITQQPLGSSIAPGDGRTFTLSFAPTTVGNNYAATVQIKSDSHTHGEFTFGVTGNGGRSYVIGDTGPGGGTVFLVSGSLHKEYSAELGYFMHSTAQTVARAHRGGFTDWDLPDDTTALQMLTHIGRAVAGTSSYWVGSTRSDGWGSIVYFQTDSANLPVLAAGSSSVSRRTRAVRSFTIH